MTNNNAANKNQLILIVDDDASIRMTAAGILDIQGYSILEADSAEACLNICQQQTPDLILLDAVMPGMDGFTCSLKLRSILGIQCPPIFMMTALDDRESIYRSFDVGITDYLVKPLNWIDLPEKIKQAGLNRAKTKKLKEQFEEIYALKEKLDDSIYQTKNKIRVD
ncbi:MAG: response regulator [Pleurocapsa sp. MO_192.B19]|nr:response regulator [Pleurocapsa sp. MO_192.B19]